MLPDFVPPARFRWSGVPSEVFTALRAVSSEQQQFELNEIHYYRKKTTFFVLRITSLGILNPRGLDLMN